MVKVGDLVKFRGELARIVGIDGNHMSLSGFGWVYDIDKSNLELVESAVLPRLQDGDLVYVLDIPANEKSVYGPNWVLGMDHYVTTQTDYKIGKLIAHPVQKVRRSQWYGTIVTIGSYTFQTYHLEPINNYDMI